MALDRRLRGILQKTSSFVSIDVVDSTAMKMGETEEDVIFSFLAYQKLVEDVMRAHGGQVVSITGDGVMSQYALSQEAVESAIDLLNRMPQFNKATQLLKNPFRVRVGVNTGKVYVDASEQSATLQILPSSAIDLAGYLQKYAPVNTAWISQFAYEQLERPVAGIKKDHFDEKFGFMIYSYKSEVAVPPLPNSKRPKSKPKILIIEDEPDHAFVFAQAFSVAGYEAEIAFDGIEGLVHLKTFKPDLVLLDIGLPRMDGWQILHEMKSNKMAPKVPVLMLARRYKVEDIEKSFAMGASGCVKKSFELRLLMRKVDTILAA